jgi:hypothetical protein
LAVTLAVLLLTVFIPILHAEQAEQLLIFNCRDETLHLLLPRPLCYPLIQNTVACKSNIRQSQRLIHVTNGRVLQRIVGQVDIGAGHSNHGGVHPCCIFILPSHYMNVCWQSVDMNNCMNMMAQRISNSLPFCH